VKEEINSNYVVGIDPGLTGYITIMNCEDLTIVCHPIPVIAAGKKGTKKSIDGPAIREILCSIKGQVLGIGIEKQQTMPKQGVSSSGKTMYGFGLLVGICIGLGTPMFLFRPVEWSKEMLRGVVGSDTKSRSIIRTKELYPLHSLKRTPRCTTDSDGMADSILIARYSMMNKIPSSMRGA
jgi:hypothetical protein